MNRRSDFTAMGILVFLVQGLLVIPIILLIEPLPWWLENERHWPRWEAVAVFILLTALLWLLLIFLIMVSLMAFQKRRRGAGSRHR